MYEALVSFCGILSMRKGEVKAITNKEVVADLLRAGYIREVKKEKAVEKPVLKDESKTAAAKPRKKKK